VIEILFLFLSSDLRFIFQKVFKATLSLVRMDEKKEHHSHEYHNKDVVEIPLGKLKSVFKNPWLIVSVVLALVVIGMIVQENISGVSKSTIETKGLEFFNSQLTQGGGTLDSVVVESGLYRMNVNYNGKVLPVYFTKDGKFVAQGNELVSVSADDANPSTNSPSNGQPVAQDVPKSDKPTVELFVMSYCPFGTQAEKGILPVFAALGNKIDGKIRFVHYTMHGEKEDTENFRQLCIREEQGSKFNAYLQCTLNSTSTSAPADPTACMQKLGIDSSKVASCITGKAADYYAVDSQLSNQYGVQGSPTLVINGVEVSSARSPAALLATICSAFNNAPAECSQQLSSSNPSAGFGFNAGTDSAAANCGV